MKKKPFRVVSSLLAAVFILSVCAAAVDLESINAYLNKTVTIIYNNDSQVFSDEGGNVVYPISYNGTTYLPIRALSNLFNIPITWDGDQNSVLIGEQTDSTVSSEQENKPVVLYLVRHGKTLFNTLDITQGIVDSPLTDVGQEQADAVGVGLSDVSFSAAYASDLGRQRETAARILYQNMSNEKPELLTDIGLREACFGKYEGKPSSEMLTPAFEQFGLQYGQFPELFQTITTSELTDLVAATDETGEAETVAQVQSRVKAAVDRIVEKVQTDGGGNVLIVSSGSAIGDVLPALNSEFDVNGEVDNCSVTILTYSEGEYTLVTRNDLSYLESGMENLASGNYPEFDYTY